jgi:NAD-dependent histone deacetylase SIR2
MVWSDPFTTSIFYMFISSLRKKIRDEVTTTTSTHKFIRTLRDGGRLVRNYTQNIDCLEEREGLCTELTAGAGNRSRFHSKTQREPRPTMVNADSAHNGGVEVVLLHGSLRGLRCGICARLCSWELEDRQSATSSGSAPDCPSCAEYNARRTGRGRRGLAVGRLRPDIVLYGEEHPNANLIAPLITHDLSLGPDFLLIMGTSLKVHGLKVMVKEFAKAVHVRGGKVVFVNRTKPPESIWGEFIDYWVEWDCDEWVLDLQRRRGDIWLPQGSQVETDNRRESAGDTKTETKRTSKAARPQCVRDDKMNGVYYTFKILDSLHQVVDSSGAKSSRPVYWDRFRPVIAPTVKAEPSKQPRKSLPAPKNPPKGGNSKKRKSCPSVLQENNNTAEKVIAEAWDRIRKFAPSLPLKPPETLRIALKDLHYNRGFPVGHLYHRSFNHNHFPNLAGFGLGNINLLTHPPCGADLPIHTPKSVPKPVLERKPITHSYGTRASARLSGIAPAETPQITTVPRDSGISVAESRADENTIVVDTPSCPPWDSIEDTIVVAAPPTEDEKPPTPPPTDPMTPSTQRIKRMGSIGAILSSPEDSGRSSAASEYFSAAES